MLPKEAIRDLACIFTGIWPTGLPANLMQARTVLLSKRSEPRGMVDSRPITILSVLARLASKIISDQLLAQLAVILPPQVSGGLPQRGVKDVSLLQHFKIEKDICESRKLGGFTLDLIKAFNKIPRAPLKLLFEKFNIPALVSTYWFSSLSKLIRFPQVYSALGQPVSSTCGIPEGDACSVLGMVLLSGTFYLKISTPKLEAFAYADNWSWLTDEFKEQWKALIKIYNFTSSLHMQIDASKSWAWGTSKTFREQCMCLGEIFPDGSVQFEVKTSAKDLGIEIHYNKQSHLGSTSDRITEGINRCNRLRWMPLEISQKALVIQTSIWPAALHGADAQYVGRKHWRDLRRAATRSLVGDNKEASAYLACTILSNRLQDPLLYTICTVLRTIRRCAHLYPALASEICDFAKNYQGKTVYGPGGALNRYLSEIGWTFETVNILVGPLGHRINLFVHSPKEIQKILSESWSHHVQLNISHRKGIGEHHLDLKTTGKVVQNFTPSEQTILSLNMVGGYQTGAIKALWATDCNGECPFCSQQDSRPHRMLHCQTFEEARKRHPKAIELLLNSRRDWIYLPIARLFPDAQFLTMVHNTTVFPKPEDYHSNIDQHHLHSSVRFYTDGSCSNPMFERAKIAGWSIIHDQSYNDQHRTSILDSLKNAQESTPQFRCVATGIVHGKQSSSRAELSAVAFAVQLHMSQLPDKRLEIFTDAQYVCNVLYAIENQDKIPLHHKMANYDLISILNKHWNSAMHRIVKVKAHRKFEEAKDYNDLWNILGNHWADHAAAMAVAMINEEITKTADDAVSFEKSEQENLRTVLSYIIDLNIQQMKYHQLNPKNQLQKLHAVEGQNQIDPDNHQSSFDLAASKLVNWIPLQSQIYLNTPLPEDILPCVSLGASITRTVWRWLMMLEWPTGEQSQEHDPNDWGISYLELVFNLVVCTGQLLPVSVNPNERYVQYVSYWSDEAILLPPKNRSANIQVYALEKWCRQLAKLSSIAVIPNFVKHRQYACTSLAKLGYHPPVAGIPKRPKLPRAEETMNLVRSYLAKAIPLNTLCLAIDRPVIQPLFDHEILEECSPKARYNSAATLRKKRLKAARNL